MKVVFFFQNEELRFQYPSSPIAVNGSLDSNVVFEAWISDTNCYFPLTVNDIEEGGGGEVIQYQELIKFFG